VDFSGPNPVLYAATSDSLSKLIKITDTSAFSDTSDNADQAIILATAAANYAFKGVALAPTTTPVIISQPSDVNNALVGTTVNLAVSATGGQPLAYQWYYTNTNTKLVDGSSGYGGTISGSTNATLTLTSVATNQIGGYQVVITNTSGSITSRVAQVTIVTALVPPTIDANISPIGSTNFVGDTVAFSVTAHGIPAVAYQWKWIPDTNNLVTNIISGANSPTFPLVNLTTNQSGKYFVTITNSAAYYTTNSAMAVLKVNPTPVLTIAQFRSMVNGSYAPTNTTAIFTIQGTVTTWADMTGSANTEFYMQDASGGIVVYWGGASATTNLPPAGAIVRVTGPLASFSGLLEISPVFGNPLHSVTVVSTNNPLPAAQPLPFDPNVTGYPSVTKNATMNAMEGMYFVASNVMLNLSAPNFVSGANDTITNNVTHTSTFSDSTMTVTFTNGAGQTFIMFINAYTDIPNQAKYTGPVTIYGVLGYYSSAGFEFTPSRFADIISYTHFTNVLSNVTRSGDLLTNTFNESALRPTETLTLSVAIADAGGGSVSLAPSTDGLPGSARWDAPVNGTTATTTFHFTPTSSDAGSNYVVGLASTTPGGTSSNFWYIYVPTPDEQQMYISEFLANPTTNTGASYFNPLHRTVDGINITTWDQYVEIANVSGATFDLYGWSITDASQTRHTFLIGAPTEQLGSSSAVVVYGGGKVGDPSPPNLSVSAFPANIGGSPSLSLAKSGRGVIVLRNPGYYNNALGNKPGYIVDRVVYNSSDLNNGSLSRFPTLNGALVPQAYISTRTNFTTAGLQYDGSPWSAPTQTPASVGNIVITAGNPVNLSFTANTNNGTTLWVANSLNDKFSVVFGNQFTNAAAQFQITNPPSTMQFYFITTQTNF
jgi:hypothetical protein